MPDSPRPVIGVTRCSRVDDYVASIEQAGAAARVLEVSESPRTLLSQLNGILLTGARAKVSPHAAGLRYSLSQQIDMIPMIHTASLPHPRAARILAIP